MTSKSLFWVRSKENHKRRIWVWVVSVLMQLAFYPGVMTVYLARIRTYQAGGKFGTAAAFKNAMFDAAADALGFQTRVPWVVIILAAMIGIQGFSYLYSRKKVDMYHSVPVPLKSRFAVVYINGIAIYLVSYLFSLSLAVGLAGINGALNGRALTECGLALVLNVLYFLVIYNAVVLAVMLAGNIIVAGGLAVALLCIGGAMEVMLGDMRENFFTTADALFTDIEVKSCVLAEYLNKVHYWKADVRLSSIIGELLPFYLKCAVSAIIFGLLAYLFYRKRPSEAAGRAIAFPVVKPVLKVAVAVLGGITACIFLYNSVFQYAGAGKPDMGSAALLCVSAGAVALLCCACLEAVYEFDVRAAVKHLFSTGVSAVIAMAVFCIYYFDVFGYDSYIPEPEKVESAAVHFFYEQSYFELDDELFGQTRYVDATDYLKEHMVLTDIDALCALIEKGSAAGGSVESMKDGRYISVLFRLKSGREVSRRYAVDFADSSNEELFDRIIGTKEFREGYYQIFKAEELIQGNNWQVSYSNGTMDTELSAEASKLREAWMKDMEQFDFSLARNHRQCGYLDFALINTSRAWRLPVYENFKNTIAYLEEEGVYVPAKVRAEDVASITVVNWNRDSGSNAAWDYAVNAEPTQAYPMQYEYQMRETYEAPDEIAKIIDAIYPADMCYSWKWDNPDAYDNNYEVYITYKTDTEYYYLPGYYSYKFLSGQVPSFVEEETSYTQGEYYRYQK